MVLWIQEECKGGKCLLVFSPKSSEYHFNYFCFSDLTFYFKYYVQNNEKERNVKSYVFREVFRFFA